MHQSINKYKFFLYFFFFIFLSSVLNIQFLENIQNKFSLKNINIYGLSDSQKKIIEIELKDIENINIFTLSDEKVLEKITKFDFLENIKVNKIIPSTINIHVSETTILGSTQRNGEKFYIGNNGKFINSNQIIKIHNTPTVFGEFKIEEYLNLINILNNYQLDIGSIKKYFYYKNGRWDLLFSNDLTLMLPSQNIDNSLKIYNKLFNNDNLKNIKIIDLRITNQIILTNKDE